MSVYSNLLSLCDNMEIPPILDSSGGIDLRKLLSHVKEIMEEDETTKSSTGKKLLPSVMLLATQYAKLKSKIDNNDNNNKSILLFNDTLSSINKTLNTTNGRRIKLFKSGDIHRFLEEYENIIENDQERVFEIENHLRGAEN
uniref:Uncharacterized protein n=1 Tax=Strongyloides venezuelensis TaxID=75913 RepID=A0A0K0FSL2_STRVS